MFYDMKVSVKAEAPVVSLVIRVTRSKTISGRRILIKMSILAELAME